MNDSIGNRMKHNYENRYRIKLSRRIPVIIRLDGKAFHTLTKNCEKPFDSNFIESMVFTTLGLQNNVQGFKCAYVQSDEISILLTDFDKLTTDAWFDYNLQKIVSISASIASVSFSLNYGTIGFFDSRAFNIPKEEVCNYFIWRQQDWTRNSIQMLARANFSHKELHKKNINEIHEMLHQKDINWVNDCTEQEKRGTLINKKGNIFYPIFKENRDVIEQYLI